MQDMSVSYGLKDYVTFPGRIPDQHMLEILSTADVCVNPDKANPMNDKSTMNKVMEYMALGKPIVQYDLTEGRFSAQEASVYARPNDVNDFAIQIQSLLDNPEKRMQMGAFGQKRVYNELHWGIESRKYLTAYDKLFSLSK
jgi:glycosyltransferase involved in cell wall biosynthesis